MFSINSYSISKYLNCGVNTNISNYFSYKYSYVNSFSKEWSGNIFDNYSKYSYQDKYSHYDKYSYDRDDHFNKFNYSYKYDYNHHYYGKYYYNYYGKYYGGHHCYNKEFTLTKQEVVVEEKDLLDLALPLNSTVDTTYKGTIVNDETLAYTRDGVINLRIDTVNTVLLTAIATNDIVCVKSKLIDIISIPEVTVALTNSLNAVPGMDVNTLLAQVQSAPDVATALGLLSNTLGMGSVNFEITATGISLVIEDATALELEGLLNVEVSSDGSYTVTSPLFNHLSVDDSVVVEFGYSATDGVNTQSETVSLTVNGTNDVPVVTVDEIIPSVSEGALTDGYYFVLCESDVLASLNIKDVDVLDWHTLTLNSDVSFNGVKVTSTDDAGIIQLDDEFIAQYGIDGNEGDFLIFNSSFVGLSEDELMGVSFDVVVFDGTESSESLTVSLDVKGIDNAFTVSPVIINLEEEALLDEALALGSNVDTTYRGQLSVNDVDVNDKNEDVSYSRDGVINLRIDTVNTVLLTAIATNDIACVKSKLIDIVSIPEVTVALTNSLNAVPGMDVNTLLAQVQVAPDVATALGLLSNTLGMGSVNFEITTTGISLVIEDATALELEGLLNVEVSSDGSYTVTSPLFNHLSVDDSVVVEFGYSATDGLNTQTETVSLTVNGTNDFPDAEIVDNGSEKVLVLTGIDPDVNDDNESVDIEMLVSNSSLNTYDIDKIDLSNGNYTIENLLTDDVLDITDSDSVLEITGDLLDSILLDSGVNVMDSSEIIAGDTQWHKDIDDSTSLQSVYVGKTLADDTVTLIIENLNIENNNI